jgi:hypothetical protein
MKIPLKPGAKPVRQRPYRLNPKYKEKVKGRNRQDVGSRNH